MNEKFWPENQTVPIKRTPSGWSVFVWILIAVLIITNGGVIFLFWQAKNMVNGLAGSTGDIFSANTWSNLKVAADSSELPADVQGEEPAGIPRYAQSARIQFEKLNEKEVNITYQTADKAESVLAFYKNNLATNDWVLIRENSAGCIFGKADQQVAITITDDKTTAFTTFKVAYISG